MHGFNGLVFFKLIHIPERFKMRCLPLSAISSILAVCLAGCASVIPTVQSDSGPDKTSGYLAGSFSRISTGGVAFVVVDEKTGQEYEMSLGETGKWAKDVKDSVMVIKLPPGQYRIAEWFTFATLTREKNKKTAVRNPALSSIFSVAPGEVLYLGNLGVQGTPLSVGSMLKWHTITSKPVATVDARRHFIAAYPLFNDTKFACKLCTDGGEPGAEIKETMLF